MGVAQPLPKAPGVGLSTHGAQLMSPCRDVSCPIGQVSLKAFGLDDGEEIEGTRAARGSGVLDAPAGAASPCWGTFDG
jgi:hypothetical protein